jgi:broad specificity phosphatase PhoE
MPAEVFIARHGQNEDNVNGVLNGHRDLPLTDLGRLQARELAEGMQAIGLTFDTIYSSPLDRAVETARIVCGVLGIKSESEVIPELIERDFGVMTGVPSAEIKARCAPDIIETETITYFLHPEGAETFPKLIERGHGVLTHVRSLRTGGRILLVCHGDIGKMIYAAATGKSWEEVLKNFHFGNGDLIEVGSTDEAHIVKLPQHNL